MSTAKERVKSVAGKRAEQRKATRAAAARKQEIHYDASSAAQALEAVRPELDALDPSEAPPARLDVERAAIAALGAAESLTNPELAARFHGLPAAEFDATQLAKLGQLAWATWYAKRSLDSAVAGHSEAALPVALVQEATELKRRMQRCTEYHLADEPDAATELAHLRAGTGYLDLARDLAGYAELYRDYEDELKHDRRLYSKADATRADAIATAMLTRLGRLDGQDAAAELAQTKDRAFALLARTYEDVAATAAWLFRHEPERAALFPSLWASSRRPGRAAAAASAADEPAPAATPTDAP